MKLWIAGGAVAGLIFMLMMPGAEAAYRSRLKICGDAWAAAKAAQKVPAGQSWQDYYKACSARLQELETTRPAGTGDVSNHSSRAAARPLHDTDLSSAKALLPAAEAVRDERVRQERPESGAGSSSARSRQKQCAAQWRELKSAGQVPEGQKWPQFWSACNTRLKANE